MFIIKEKDAVYFASAITEWGWHSCARIDTACRENLNLWPLNDGYGTIVMANASDQRRVDLLRYSNVFDCEFSYDGMHEAVARIKELFGGTNCISEDNRPCVDIFVARGAEGFHITYYGVVEELGDFTSFGGSREHYRAANEFCKNIENVTERINAIYTMAETTALYQFYPVAVISTRDSEITMLNGNR